MATGLYSHPLERLRVLSDGFEPVSAGAVTLTLIRRRDRATRRERRHGSA